ncbi:copper resistance CopC/CopD family protein [Nocardioides maradonensis]
MKRSLAAAIVVAVAALLVLVAAPSFAHATVQSSDPAPGSVLQTAPTSVTITFDEAVTAVPQAMRVFGPDGSRVDTGAVLRPDGDGNRLGIAVDAQAKGTYLVSWRVISADSHPVSGAFTFSVGRTTTAPTAAAIGTNQGLSLLLWYTRLVGYAGSAVLLGATLLLGLADGVLGSAPSRRRMIGLGALALLVSSVVALLVQGPYDAGLGGSAIARPSLVGDVLATTFGHGLLLRVAATAAFVAVLVAARGRVRTVLLVLAGLVLAASFAMTGHGVSTGLTFVSTTVHVVVSSLWIGGLVGLVTWVVRDPFGHAETLRRFSWTAMGCVGALVLTGTFQAWRQVGEWAALTATTYGKELLFKLGLVACALGAAFLSRRWVHRRSGAPKPDAEVIRRSVVIELALAACVFSLTASLAATEPAVAAYHPTVAASLTAGPDRVQVSAVPAGDRTLDLHLYLSGPDRQPTTPAEVTASVALVDQDLGPLPIALTVTDPGHYAGTIAVPVKGTWTLSVTVRTTAIDQYVATTDLPVR